MRPGRRPKPTALKLVTGNPGRRPLNTREPDPAWTARASPAPLHLSREAMTEWRRVAPVLHRLGVLKTTDRAVLAAYCQSYGRWVIAEKLLAEDAKRDETNSGLLARTINGAAIQNPLLGIANKAHSDMVRYAAELGLTPSSRSRIDAQPPPGFDPTYKYLS